jgi:predicted RNase H-like HicB family nuclease
MNLKVVIEEDTEDGGYVVSCPALPGCHSQGETVDEALANIEDAIRGCIEALNDRAARAGGATVLDVTVWPHAAPSRRLGSSRGQGIHQGGTLSTFR